MGRGIRLAFMVVAAVAVLGLKPAEAVPKLQLSSGGSTVTIDDGDPFLDANPAVGAVTYIGAVGGWTINVTSGFSDPALPGPYPHLDTSSANIGAASASTLTILFTDTHFSPFSGGFFGQIGGTRSGAATSVTYNVYYDNSNSEFGMGNLALGIGPLTNTPFAASGVSSPLTLVGPFFSVTQELILSTNGAATISFNAEVMPVPEPGTLLLIGSGLTALWVRRRRPPV